MKATHEYSPSEQFEAAVAAGIPEKDMLRNVDARIDRVTRAIAEECRRVPAPEYAAKFIRQQAEVAIALRDLRSFILARLLGRAA